MVKRRVTFIDYSLPKQIFFDGSENNGMQSSYSNANQSVNRTGILKTQPIKPKQNSDLFPSSSLRDISSTTQQEYSAKKGERYQANRPRTSDLWKVLCLLLLLNYPFHSH